MKSHVMHSQVYFGGDIGYNKPPGRWCSIFTCRDTRHHKIVLTTSIFSPDHHDTSSLSPDEPWISSNGPHKGCPHIVLDALSGPYSHPLIVYKPSASLTNPELAICANHYSANWSNAWASLISTTIVKLIISLANTALGVGLLRTLPAPCIWYPLLTVLHIQPVSCSRHLRQRLPYMDGRQSHYNNLWGTLFISSIRCSNPSAYRCTSSSCDRWRSRTLHADNVSIYTKETQVLQAPNSVLDSSTSCQDSYAITLPLCINTQARPILDASLYTTKSSQLSDRLSVGAIVSVYFWVWKLCSHASIHTKWSFFLVSHVRGFAKEEKPYMNLL